MKSVLLSHRSGGTFPRAHWSISTQAVVHPRPTPPRSPATPNPWGRALPLYFAFLLKCWSGYSSTDVQPCSTAWLSPEICPTCFVSTGSTLPKPAAPLGSCSSAINKAGTKGAVLEGPRMEGRVCCLWLPATAPLTRKKCAGDVLLAGGLALWYLTSEVSPPKKRALFVVRARGLDETLGRREYVPGEGVAHQGAENPPCLRGAWLPGQGTLSNCWRAWPAPESRCALASQVCHLTKRSPRVLVSTAAFLCQSFPYTLGSAPFRITACPGRLDPLLLLYRVTGLPPRLTPPGHRVPCPLRAVSQPSCQLSELKSLLLFKAYFLAPGPA